jgi:3'(2'), 5'-bisphosphate nucleotidase
VDHHPYEELVLDIARIARRAGAAILDIYQEADFGVETKADNSPLTRADRAANEVIVDGLRQLSFQAPIVSEENKAIPYTEREQYTRFWLVDPLDGTKEFIKRNGDFTVNIALIESGTPTLGVAYVPATDELYYAVKGQGAFLEKEGQRTQLQANPFRMTDAGLRVVASRSHLNDDTKAFFEELTDPKVISRGSSLKLLILAAGGAEVYPRLGPTMEWDIAAAHVILTEAGGHVIDRESGKELRYNKPSMLNPYFVAYGAVEPVPGR